MKPIFFLIPALTVVLSSAVKAATWVRAMSRRAHKYGAVRTTDLIERMPDEDDKETLFRLKEWLGVSTCLQDVILTRDIQAGIDLLERLARENEIWQNQNLLEQCNEQAQRIDEQFLIIQNYRLGMARKESDWDEMQCRIEELETYEKTVSNRAIDLHADVKKLETQRDQLAEALEEAVTGIEWYIAEYPEAASGADDEFLERAKAALSIMEEK